MTQSETQPERNYPPPIPVTAIGSSYLLRQVAGSERVGGLRVTLKRRSDGSGTITTRLTDWQSGELLEWPIDDACVNAATEAIDAFIAENSLDLSGFDICLDRFLFHPVDSSPWCFRQTAHIALQTALATLNLSDFS